MTIIYSGGGNGMDRSREASTYFSPSSEIGSDVSINNLAWGAKWGIGIGEGVNLTYSFSDNKSVNLDRTVVSMSPEQMQAAKNAMQAYSNIANIKFIEVADAIQAAGDIRWSYSNTTGSSYARYPGPNAGAGDIYLGSSTSNPTIGSYDYRAFLHELGHALGLQHPHNTHTKIDPLPGQDQLKYSLMSYKEYEGASGVALVGNFFPTTPMLNDVAVIQKLYGDNNNYRDGNDRYRWESHVSVYETIVDGGGIDTLDASNQAQAVLLNLNSGQWSQIGVAFRNGQAYVRDCLTIAYGDTIENATGSVYADTLIGNAANNVLDGGAGVDTMRGGAGSDTYYVDQTGDVVTESANEGIDTVISTATYTLSANTENLTLGGTAAINGTGNGQSNVIQGNAGNNVLDGGAGADTMRGGAGDDSYYVDQTGDSIVENANEGVDTVNTLFSYTLGSNIENLTLLGTSAINGTGNSLNNTIQGNSGNNVLDGRTGADTLRGGAGNDVYYVDQNILLPSLTGSRFVSQC